jgi:hypothetical protein
MAKLLSEDHEIVSSLELLNGGEKVSYGAEVWEPLALNLVSGPRLLSNVKAELLQESLLCSSPRDEISELLEMLKDLLATRSDRVLFEPQEPFFELMIERSGRHGLKVETWMDAGDAQTGIYTWDALGIRFQTTNDNLEQFIRAIQSEFAC